MSLDASIAKRRSDPVAFGSSLEPSGSSSIPLIEYHLVGGNGPGGDGAKNGGAPPPPPPLRAIGPPAYNRPPPPPPPQQYPSTPSGRFGVRPKVRASPPPVMRSNTYTEGQPPTAHIIRHNHGNHPGVIVHAAAAGSETHFAAQPPSSAPPTGNHVGVGGQRPEDPNTIEYYPEVVSPVIKSAAGANPQTASPGNNRPPYIKYNSFANY